MAEVTQCLLDLAQWLLAGGWVSASYWVYRLAAWCFQVDGQWLGLWVGGTGAVLAAGFWFGMKVSKAPVVKHITLADLSPLWLEKEKPVIPLAALAPLWRQELTPEEVKKPVILKETVWRHPAAAEFWQRLQGSSWFAQTPPQLAVCRLLLEILDREDCPSVVNAVGDADAGRKESSYRILAQVTLLDHTLHVAALVEKILLTDEACHVIPDTMVAALAHDLGKLPSCQGSHYVMGEHPLASCQLLEIQPGFAELLHREEILQAVKRHHKRVEGLLGKTLVQADQLAREQELATAARALPLREPPSPTQPGPALAKKEPDNQPPATVGTPTAGKKPKPPPPPRPSVAKSKKRPAENKPSAPLTLMALPWFDADVLLAGLEPYINLMYGRVFYAFSLPIGYVYFQIKLLEMGIREQAKEADCHEIAGLPEGDQEIMPSVLFTIVHHLRVERAVIAEGLIKEGYYGGYFDVNFRERPSLKGYYTPFHSDPFGSLAALEQRKGELLQDILRVVPHGRANQGEDYD